MSDKGYRQLKREWKAACKRFRNYVEAPAPLPELIAAQGRVCAMIRAEMVQAYTEAVEAANASWMEQATV